LKSGEALLLENFNEEQLTKKNEIVERGNKKNEEKLKWEESLEKNTTEISSLEKANSDLQNNIDEIKINEAKVEDDEDYIKAIAGIKELEEAIANPPKADTEALVVKETAISTEIDELNQQLGQKKVRTDLETELERLRNSETVINQKILDWKRIDSGIKAYLKDRSEILEAKVNKEFELIRFRLFDFKNDGEPIMVCWPTIKGVHYKTLNTAARTAAQVDVMNTFIRKTGVVVPLFLDNQESVGSRPDTPSQVINCEFHKHADYKQLQILN